MKTLSRHNKIFLAAGSLIVLLAVVVAVVFSRQGGTGLFGSGVRSITPSDPSIHVGQTVELVVDAVYKCDWSSSDPAVVSFAGDPNNTKTVTVQANASGQAEIRAECAGGTHGTTVVSVSLAITPENFSLSCDSDRNYITLSTGNPSTRWTLSSCNGLGGYAARMQDYAPDLSHTGPWVGLTGLSQGYCTVTATTDGMADSINFYVACIWEGDGIFR